VNTFAMGANVGSKTGFHESGLRKLNFG